MMNGSGSKKLWFCLLVAALLVGWLIWVVSSRQPRPLLVHGRSVENWVHEVRIGGFHLEKDVALEALASAGPNIIPDLSRLLRRPESAKDLAMRLPNNLISVSMKNQYASESEVLVMKAKAAWVLGGIVYRNTNGFETSLCVPPLLSGLKSGSREVRTYSVQALGAIGRAASNAVPELIAKTVDEDSGVRMSAVESLGRIGFNSPASLAAMSNALTDPIPDVSFTATKALRLLQQPKN